MKFNLWVTLVVAESVDSLIAQLVRQKVTVAALGHKGITSESGASALVALRLTTQEDQEPSVIVGWVTSILNDLGVLYHNVIVTGSSMPSSWTVGEIKLPTKSAWSKLNTSCDQE